jgi:hypothetical protein
MNVEKVIAAASAQTGLSEIGDPAILEGLRRLLEAYPKEARFTERGLQMAYGSLVANLAIRMKVEDWLKRHPELLERPIEKPMFVFGLPRTGTTLLINLLHADPARRSFLRWEALDPVPPPKAEELFAGPRYDVLQAQSEYALKAMPEIVSIHYEDAGSPTECQFSMTPSFVAQVYEALADIPSYRRWFLHEADYLPAFRFHKRFLQMLQSEAPGRWTLKNPWHPLYLDALTTVYPDAQLVMTHRDPAEVVGSCCSLIRYSRQIFSDDVDLEGIGRTFIETFQVMIQRALAYKQKHGWDSIYDVQYADMMGDPIGTVGKIYDRFGEPFTAEAKAAMAGYMANNPQGKHGKHSYSLEDYGLTKQGVREQFREYIETFKIPVRD